MKGLGYLLITGGFLAGSYFTVQQPDGVPVGPYLVVLALGIAGVVMVRHAVHQEAREEGVIAGNLGLIDGSLASVVAKIQALDGEKESVDVYELRHRIDSVAHRFGLQAYADVMNPFAAGERALNRVWSTSTDGYIDEAHTYIGKAREQFEEALAVFRQHHP